MCFDVIFGCLEELELKFGGDRGKTETLAADLGKDGEDSIVASRGVVVEDGCLGSRESNEVEGTDFENDG